MSRRIKIGEHQYTELQIQFYDRYRFDPELNASRAYRATFPNCKKPASSWENASKLLRAPKGRAYLTHRALEEQCTTKIKPSIDRVLEELNVGAYFNPKRLFDENDRLKRIHELPDDVARAITSIKHTKRVERIPGTGKPEITYYNTEIKLLGKKETLELIGKHLVMFTEKFQIESEEAMHKRVRAEIVAEGEEILSMVLANTKRQRAINQAGPVADERPESPVETIDNNTDPEYIASLL